MESSTGATTADGLAARLATALAADLERIVGLFRSLSPPSGLSMTAAATLASIERFGPQRLTLLAAREGVTQPAMTQLISRLEEAGLMRRAASPDDGRVVLVTITDAGRATLARRRAVRAERLAGILAQLSPAHQEALASALPALDVLASIPREDDPVTAGHPDFAARTTVPRGFPNRGAVPQ
jgi:DNA-binding MarR family transcriptional regulator